MDCGWSVYFQKKMCKVPVNYIHDQKGVDRKARNYRVWQYFRKEWSLHKYHKLMSCLIAILSVLIDLGLIRWEISEEINRDQHHTDNRGQGPAHVARGRASVHCLGSGKRARCLCWNCRPEWKTTLNSSTGNVSRRQRGRYWYQSRSRRDRAVGRVSLAVRVCTGSGER